MKSRRSPVSLLLVVLLVVAGCSGSDAALDDEPVRVDTTRENAYGSQLGVAEISPDGRQLAVYRLGTVEVWDIEAGTFEAFEPDSDVEAISWSPDGSQLALSYGGSLEIVNARSGAVVNGVRRATDPSLGLNSWQPVTFSSDGQFLLTGGRVGRYWSVEFGNQKAETSDGESGRVSAVAFASSDLALLGDVDGQIRVWDLKNDQIVRTIEAHSTTVLDIAVSPDGTQFISVGDWTARVWDLASGSEVLVFDEHLAGSRSVRYSPDGTMAITGATDRTARVWEVATGKPLKVMGEAVRMGGFTHPELVEKVGFSADGAHAIVVTYDAGIAIWPLTDPPA